MASALLKLTDVQIGQSLTATNNFTMYQPASPDGTVRWGVGNSGSVTDIITLTSSSQVGIGTTSPNTYSAKVAIVTDGSLPAGSPAIHIEGGSNNERINVRSTQAFNGAVVAIGSSGGTASARTASAAGDLGYYFFSGYSGTNFVQQAGMVGYAGSTWSGSNYEAGVYFMTTPNGSTTRTERMRIDSSGNVGIGTSSPGVALDILRGTTSDNYVRTANANIQALYGISGTVGALSGTQTNHPYLFYTNNTERMRIDSSGNVGIGTSSPSARLQILSTGSWSAANWGKGFYVTTSGSLCNPAIGISDATGSNNWAIVNLSGALSFNTGPAITDSSTAGVERMRIDSSGNLLVNATATVNGARVYISSGDSESIRCSQNSGNRYPIVFMNGGNTVGSIQTSTTNTTYNTSSDYRLKENVQPMQNALSTVAQLNPVAYTWKADGSDGQGFIAHELQAVVPDCVTGEKDAVDEEGNPVYQGIDTSFLVATLTKAIQEQQEQINQLKAEVAALKGA